MPTITGRATFDYIEISPQPDDEVVHLAGHYNEHTTTYEAPAVHLGGEDELRIPPEGAGTLMIEPDDYTDPSFVWVEATKTHLIVTPKKPE